MGMTDTSINEFNARIRETPWYQEWFAQRGLNPNQVKLNEQQRNELKQLIQQQTGFQMPKDMKIDPAGNLNEKGGWAGLPTGVKIAIIAGATIATAGAAGAFSGAAGAASGASGASGGSTLATVGGTAGTGLSTMSRIGQLARGVSRATSAATESAAQRQAGAEQNQYTADAQNAQNALSANAQNISGENSFQSQQQSMAQLEAAQQEAARKNLYRASVMKNPMASPENKRGVPTFSPEMVEGMTNLEKAALDRTRTTQYSTAQMRAPRDYQPYTPQVISAPSSRPSTMQTVGNWLAPTLSTIGMVSDLW